MALTGWIARHTGMPSLVPTSTGPVYAGDRLLTVVGHDRVGVPVSDPLAPVGVAVTYTQGTSRATLTRASVGGHALTDPTGHVVAPIRWLADDSTDLGVEVSTSTTSMGAADRWPLAQPPASFTLECLTEGEATRAVQDLASRPSRLVLLHDQAACQMVDCDVAPVRVVVVTKAVHARTKRVPRAQRRWSLSCSLRDGLEDVTSPAWRGERGCAAPVVTWGEWDAADHAWRNRTYLDVCRLVAGMPS